MKHEKCRPSRWPVIILPADDGNGQIYSLSAIDHASLTEDHLQAFLAKQRASNYDTFDDFKRARNSV